MAFENAKKRYIQEKHRFNTGYGEVFWIKGLIETFTIIYLAVRVSGYSIPTWVYCALAVSCVAGLWSIGYLWDKSHMYHLSTEFGNKRNYFVKEMRKALKGKGLNK